MFVTNGSLEDILNWFHKGPFRYLLLFAAGDAKSASFIASMFDHKETIDVVSSEEVAVFLFYKDQTVAVELPIGEGTFAYIPGERLGPARAPRYWLGQLSLQPKTVRVTEIFDRDVKNRVVESSISFTHQIVEHFGLDSDDVPSLILLHYGHPDPLIVRTRGQEDIEAVIQFLKELRKIRPPGIEMPRKKKRHLRSRLRKANIHLEQARTQLGHALAAWREYLSARGVCERTLQPIVDTADGAAEVLWLSEPKEAGAMPEALRPAYPLFEAAWRDKHFESICRVIKTGLDRYRAICRSTKELERQLDHYTRLATGLEPALTGPTKKFEEQTKTLAEKYERKLRLKHAAAKVLAFVQSVTGVGKHAKELADITSQFRKLLSE